MNIQLKNNEDNYQLKIGQSTFNLNKKVVHATTATTVGFAATAVTYYYSPQICEAVKSIKDFIIENGPGLIISAGLSCLLLPIVSKIISLVWDLVSTIFGSLSNILSIFITILAKPDLLPLMLILLYMKG